MGEVNLSDMFMALYRTRMKTHRWYIGLFPQDLDIYINNAWLLYRREFSLLKENPKSSMPLKKFRISVAKGLFQTNKIKGHPSNSEAAQPSKKIKNPVKPRPEHDSRLDKLDHFPIFQQKGRCRNCKFGQTNVFCRKCNIRLCLIPD